MQWRRKEKAAAMAVYERLSTADGSKMEVKVPRGHVPVIVGRDGGALERFVVHVRLFKDPCIAMLLDMGAQEFGHHQQGVLRIPCDGDHFRRVIEAISKAR